MPADGHSRPESAPQMLGTDSGTNPNICEPPTFVPAQHLWRRLRSGVTQRRESARMWSDHQSAGRRSPCRREKGGSPAFLKSCVCAPPLKRPVGDQLQLRNARATWPPRPSMSCRDPSDDACAVARHAEHVEGRGSSVCRGGYKGRRTTLTKRTTTTRENNA